VFYFAVERLYFFAFLMMILWYACQATLGLLKVVIARLQAEDLQKHLKSMVDGLLLWLAERKIHFKAKV